MKIKNIIIVIAILVGLLTGLTDIVIDYYMFHEKPFWNLLIFNVPFSEIVERFIILIVFVISGFVVSNIFSKKQQAEEALQLAHKDLKRRVEERTAELIEINRKLQREIEERKQAEELILESDKRYRMLFESAGDAIFVVEGEGERMGDILETNLAAAEMHGYSVDELLKLNLIRDLDAPDASKAAPERARRIMSGEWIKAEIEHIRKDGSIFPVEISAGLLEFMGHKYILAIDRDITERKRAEEALRRVEQMELVGQWATWLACEIKNSLAGIKISVQVLFEELTVSEEHKSIVLRSLDEIKLIEILLKNLLDFAKPTKLQLSTFKINDLLDQTITSFFKEPNFPSDLSSKISVLKDFDDTDPEILADLVQLKHVFLNVMRNALEAMGEGTISVKSAHIDNANMIKIEISDTGPGIDKQIIDDVFKPFFTRKPKKPGLGLTISRRIVEEHGGAISVVSEPGKWTSFCVSLPLTTEGETQDT